DLDIVLVGLGSRFAATLLDLTIQIGAIIALGMALGLGSNSGYVIAAYFALVFLVLFAYDIVFETWNSGRTIGKLAAGIRVVRTSGQPVNFMTSAVRNLIRIVDFLPLFYTVGMISVIVTERNQRLGDLAAGTYVVRERRAIAPVPQQIAAPAAALGWAPPPMATAAYMSWDVSTVTADEVATVRRFLERRATLDPHARAQLGWDLATRLRAKVAGVDDHGAPTPEAFLEGLAAAKAARG
ncbi:MAG: RDD family protein, partial [Acidimicrobiia bacterium]